MVIGKQRMRTRTRTRTSRLCLAGNLPIHRVHRISEYCAVLCPFGAATHRDLICSADNSDSDSHTSESDSDDPRSSSDATRARVEESLRSNITRVHFPRQSAGAILRTNVQNANTTYTGRLELDDSSVDNVYAPFATELDWKVARWAKLRGPGSNAFSELIAIPEVCIILLFMPHRI